MHFDAIEGSDLGNVPIGLNGRWTFFADDYRLIADEWKFWPFSLHIFIGHSIKFDDDRPHFTLKFFFKVKLNLKTFKRLNGKDINESCTSSNQPPPTRCVTCKWADVWARYWCATNCVNGRVAVVEWTFGGRNAINYSSNWQRGVMANIWRLLQGVKCETRCTLLLA